MLPPQAQARVVFALGAVTEVEEEEEWDYICIACIGPGIVSTHHVNIYVIVASFIG
jgi:hypothetical protein